MKFLVDMNLPSKLTGILENAGWEAVHWSSVGADKASDVDIMAWARENNFVIITLDLDFGELLALTEASGPSVIQLRATHGLHAIKLAPYLVEAILNLAVEIQQGAIVSIDFNASRVRLLPFSG